MCLFYYMAKLRTTQNPADNQDRLSGQQRQQNPEV